MTVSWAVELADEFEPEFDLLHEDVQTEILALALLLEQFGAAARPAPRRYAQRLPPREYEGTAVQRGGW